MAGIYISYPFCAQKCTFCNFASGVFGSQLEVDYLSALEAEVQAHSWQWRPETLYLGGGTPSRLDDRRLSELLSLLPGKPWCEATIEAAPGSLTLEKLQQWREAGINRVSLGVQSFVKQELTQTGRTHDAETVVSDSKLLRDCGFENFNIDLIAGLPYQTRESWLQSLAWIERLQPPHVSIYLFELDQDSRLGLEILNNGGRYGATQAPGDDLATEMYELGVERLRQLGLERYEISNFARPGYESLHNLKYWQLEPYIGFGADAHSLDAGQRWSNVETAREYVERYTNGLSPLLETHPANHAEERFFVGLRLLSGVDLTNSEWQDHREPISRFIGDGLLERSGGYLRFTSRGVLLSNEVLQEFIR